ncbi:MAG: sigma-70 family RNA polymerase sigma factor [Gammaproteobacteria bacterium]|nr:sigma-70 family RNA polymerase sigma factor [Gammaproteobacteria bacterium]
MTTHRSSPQPAPQAARIDVERLFRDHNAALLRFIAARVGSEHEAREIAQEAYVHLLQLDQPGAISYLRAFLFRTAANLAIDRLRQRGRRSHVGALTDMDIVAFDLSPERQIAGQQSMQVLAQAIEELPARCRQAFLLHRFHDLHVDEIAARMSIGACMVRRYIARALEYLRARVDMQGARPPERQP